MIDNTPPAKRTPFAWIADMAVDAAALAGAGLVDYGVWLVYRPAAFVVAGAFLLGGAWLLARKGAA